MRNSIRRTGIWKLTITLKDRSSLTCDRRLRDDKIEKAASSHVLAFLESL
jgi:hypothetical protein